MERSLSKRTAELSDPDDPINNAVVSVDVNMSIVSIVERYKDTVRKLRNAICAINDTDWYWMEPIVVAEGVDFHKMLEKIPSVVDEFRVKCAVVDSRLIIIALSAGEPQSLGIGSINQSTGNWNSENGNPFSVLSNANSMFCEGSARAPDLVMSIPRKYTLTGQKARAGNACLATQLISVVLSQLYFFQLSLRSRSIIDLFPI